MKIADVIIIGSGIAALQLAVQLSKQLNVIVLTKSKIRNGNSYLAQGGIAIPLASEDSPYLHYIDTLEAGSFHHIDEAVLGMTTDAVDLLKELQAEGCQFDKDDSGNLKLGMEGAHSARRIVHSGGDATGKVMVDFLISKLTSNVKVLEESFVYELLLSEDKNECVGVKASMRGNVEYLFAPHVVLATGGCGQLYEFSSNSSQATGDGLALAYLAGAELTDMEFIQFHPTLLYSGGKVRGLISEAVRGEGARLVDEQGALIMDGVHPLKDLAPRHIVSQTIYEKLRNGVSVYLDIKNIEDFHKKFPTITKLCNEAEIELEKGLIPVAPGSHFLMGGVVVDEVGKSTIEGLFAIGEVACTGIHGANRLASNSLLEGLYYGKKLAKWINEHPRNFSSKSYRKKMDSQLMPTTIQLPSLQTIQCNMMSLAGIVRAETELLNMKSWLEGFQLKQFSKWNLDGLNDGDKLRLFTMLTAWMITSSALERTESRGGHFRADFPFENNDLWKKKRITLKKIMEEKQDEPSQTALVT
ncbi:MULTISPECIES: L-aspartate oxidase [unclassified Bacillus (in: firmicutes)]|uniref:L-aspartate oxidase n=1 Tax=unclassified Bacillus (in: firmicutes) TaxID=185979 RepID=UPI0008EA5048|nr:MULTISPECIES: L-aspartate oxidase [unclassified Bacillus (in: firmicutes)]SFB15988.1 L-aspartate oxidase [Bacillus sp. UNCCL13]SFQ78391.1 L-aspartate oxidase [Bacillus sp. cl95]